MKRLLPVLLLLPAIAFGQKPKKFQINGDLGNIAMPVEKVYLQYRAADSNVMDSVQPENGKYRFTGKISEPLLARIRVKYKAGDDGTNPAPVYARDIAPVFLESGKFQITSEDSFSNITVKSNRAHAAYTDVMAMAKPYSDKLNALYAEYSAFNKEKNEEGMKETEKKINEVSEQSKENVYAAFLRKNPRSPVALWALQQYAGWDIDAEKVDPLFAMLPASTRNTPSARSFAEQLEIARKTGIGKYAMDFSQNDTSGVAVQFSSFRGKYVLVDFWASWCGPCRVENPNVVKAFQTYKDKGFTVLGISLDREGQKDRWLKAIHDDNLTWTHVSDLKFWDNEVAKMYGIRAIPQNLLVDPQGVIIGKNLRGEELQEKLAEVFSAAKAF